MLVLENLFRGGIMIKITINVEGMVCDMCAAHINDTIRKAFPVKKVISSHSKNQTIIVTEKNISEQELRQVIDATGYQLIEMHSEPYEKKRFFSLIK